MFTLVVQYIIYLSKEFLYLNLICSIKKGKIIFVVMSFIERKNKFDKQPKLSPEETDPAV